MTVDLNKLFCKVEIKEFQTHTNTIRMYADNL